MEKMAKNAEKQLKRMKLNIFAFGICNTMNKITRLRFISLGLFSNIQNI